MNRVERAKAKALGCCRFVPGSAAKRFAREMRWLALNEPATVLSPSQRWYLDKMVWHYRRQLAGTDIEIPASEPTMIIGTEGGMIGPTVDDAAVTAAEKSAG